MYLHVCVCVCIYLCVYIMGGKVASYVCVVPLIKLALANRRPQGDFGIYICILIYIDS